MNARKSLVKFFGPVLLLTASLALPADTMAAPGHGKQAQAAHAKAENPKKQNKKQNANKKQRQQQTRTARQQRQVRQERQQAPQRQRHQQVARQKAAKQKAVKQKAVKQKAVKQQVVRQPSGRQRQLQAQRQIALQQQRQVELQRQNQIRLQQQRQLTLQRQAELRRQAQVQQRNTFRNRNRYHAAVPYRSGGRRGGGGADPNIFAIDGYLSDEGRECLTLRGHDGRLWSLVGGTYGLQPGEHVRLYGRIVDGGACGWQGTAYDIHQVQTVWADDRHRTTYYDHLYDGPFDQLGQSGDYYDDRYDDGYYDPYNNGVDLPYRN